MRAARQQPACCLCETATAAARISFVKRCVACATRCLCALRSRIDSARARAGNNNNNNSGSGSDTGGGGETRPALGACASLCAFQCSASCARAHNEKLWCAWPCERDASGQLHARALNVQLDECTQRNVHNTDDDDADWPATRIEFTRAKIEQTREEARTRARARARKIALVIVRARLSLSAWFAHSGGGSWRRLEAAHAQRAASRKRALNNNNTTFPCTHTRTHTHAHCSNLKRAKSHARAREQAPTQR